MKNLKKEGLLEPWTLLQDPGLPHRQPQDLLGSGGPALAYRRSIDVSEVGFICFRWQQDRRCARRDFSRFRRPFSHEPAGARLDARVRSQPSEPAEKEDPSTLDAEELEVLRFARLHETGIYCALGRVEGFEEGDPAGAVHKVAMSMGWNPTFGDVKAKTIEPWILHEFKEDFYGRHLRLVVIGYVRPELKFDDMDELIREIKADGAFCREALDEPALAALAEDRFLRGADGRPDLPRAPPTVPAPPPCGPRWSADLRTALLDVPPLCPGSSRLLLVRHGEAVANEQGQLCGGTNDSELTPRGRAQAAELAAELAVLLPALGITLDLVGSSPLRRAVASADEVASRFPGAARAELEALREMEYGSLEGARIEEVRDEVAAVAKRWRDGERSRAPPPRH